MGFATKLRRLDEDDIVKWGVEVPVAGMIRGQPQEIRDIAIVFGASLNLPRPAKTRQAPAPPPAEAGPQPKPRRASRPAASRDLEAPKPETRENPDVETDVSVA